MSASFDNFTPTPDKKSFTLIVDHAGNITPTLVDFQPRNPDGSVFDLTATSQTDVRIWDGVADPFAKTNNGTPVWTGDATGLHCTFSVGDAYMLLAGTTPKYSVICLDSNGHYVLAATGTVSFQLIPKSPQQP